MKLPKLKLELSNAGTYVFKKEFGYYIVTVEFGDPICRVQGSDQQRILYIGSGILNKRVRKFSKVVQKSPLKGHAGAVTYTHRKAIYEKRFPFKQLRVHFNYSDSKIKALRKEDLLQREYELEFGELPPLNLSRAKKN